MKHNPNCEYPCYGCGEIPPGVKIKQESTVSFDKPESPTQGNYTLCWNVILMDPKLDHGAKVLYLFLLVFAQRKNYCFPGQKRLARLLCTSIRTCRRYASQLTERGLIRIKRRGMTKPNKYIIIPIEEVYSSKRSRKILSRGKFVKFPKERTPVSHQKGSTESERTPASDLSGHPCPTKNTKDEERKASDVAQARRSVFVDLAKQLSSTVGKVRKLPTTATPVKWGWPIERLHKVEGVPIERIKHAMEWYCSQLLKEGDINSNGNPSFLPVAYSGKAFATKFEKIEGAMGRRGVKLRFVTPRKNLTYDQVETMIDNRMMFIPKSDPRYKRALKEALEQAGNPSKE